MSSFNCQFNEGPKGPKLNWDCTKEMSKCDTGNISFCHKPHSKFTAKTYKKNIRSELTIKLEHMSQNPAFSIHTQELH